MVSKGDDSSQISYILGIVSIVMAFFTPLAGIIFGVIGLIQSKKQKDSLSKKAKTLNTVGIVIGLILLIVTIIATVYFSSTVGPLV
jgi:4-hydroxybenzoate polyprenyltransferase